MACRSAAKRSALHVHACIPSNISHFEPQFFEPISTISGTVSAHQQQPRSSMLLHMRDIAVARAKQGRGFDCPFWLCRALWSLHQGRDFQRLARLYRQPSGCTQQALSVVTAVMLQAKSAAKSSLDAAYSCNMLDRTSIHSPIRPSHPFIFKMLDADCGYQCFSGRPASNATSKSSL